MQINENITVNFSVEDLKGIVIQYLEGKGYSVDNVNFNVQKSTEGFFMNEHEVVRFTGANCSVKRS